MSSKKFFFLQKLNYDRLKFRIKLILINIRQSFNVCLHYKVSKKKGLSHVYILIMLHSKNRFLYVNEINVIINIKISNKSLYFNLYIIVIQYMLYNNCNQYITFKIDIILFY